MTSTIHSKVTMDFPQDRVNLRQRGGTPMAQPLDMDISAAKLPPKTTKSSESFKPPVPPANAAPTSNAPQTLERPSDIPSWVQLDDVPRVNNAMPGIGAPIADAEGISLALPSRFAFYGFKDFYVRPFKAKHLSKLQRAHAESSVQPIVEALSDVAFTTDPAYVGVPLAFELTLADFFFVLYWMRLNAFTKAPYTHETVCNNEEHIRLVELANELPELEEKVRNKELSVEEFQKIKQSVLPKESLKIGELVRKTDIVTTELESIPDPNVFRFEDAPELFIRPPIMRDVLEMAESPKMQDAKSREEFGYLAELASHFQHKHTYLPLEKRVDIAGELSPDQVQIIRTFQRSINYGVDETVDVTCKTCGHKRKSKLTLGAHSFFL